ncbi:TPA: PTS transporter subunit EIIC [Streptococcus suis]
MPVITAAGMIKAVLSLLTVFGVVATDDTNYQILNFIGDAGIFFLPIFLGGSAARQFKTNQQLGMLIGAILLHPNFVALVTAGKDAGTGLNFFSIPITLSSYSSTVIPVILAVWFMSYVERVADKISPKAIKFFSVPLLTTLMTALVTLIVLGPLGTIVGNWLGAFFLWLEEFGPWVVPTIVGTVSPFLVMTGTHYGLVSIGINNRMTIGYDTIAQPGMFPSNVAQGGAALAIALKTKDVNKRVLASSAGITAIFGITEPALYGVTLRHRPALIGTMVAGGIGGFFMGIMGARNFSGGSPGLLTIAAYIGEDTLKYFYTAVAGLVISVLISFVVTFVLYKED